MSEYGSLSGSESWIIPRRRALVFKWSAIGSMHMYERVTTIGFRTCEYVVLIAVLSRWAGAKWFRTRESGLVWAWRGCT